MGSTRARKFLKYSTAAIVGGALGSALTLWTHIQFRHALSLWATLSAAQIIETTGDEDKATILLSQAVAEDNNPCPSYEVLGDIYSHKGNRKLGLELFKKALEVRDRDSWVLWDPFRALGCDRLEREDIRVKIEAIEMGLEFPGLRDGWRWSVLRARVYSHRGNKEVALKLYDLALRDCDRQKCVAADRESISKEIGALQGDLKAERENSEHK